MEIKKPAIAGTLESSDCMVTVEPGNGKIVFSGECSCSPIWKSDEKGDIGDTRQSRCGQCEDFYCRQGRS